MENPKTGPSVAPRGSGKQPNIEELLSQGNWEERVAAARQKREQLQAERPNRKKMTPTFPEFAPQIVEAPDPKPENTNNKPPVTSRANLPDEPQRDIPPPVAIVPPAVTPAPEPAPTAIAAPPLPAQQEKRRVDRAVLVTFACFFGIGIGLALGAGLVWSMGGFNGFGRTGLSQSAQIDVAPKPLQVAFALRPNPNSGAAELDVALPIIVAAPSLGALETPNASVAAPVLTLMQAPSIAPIGPSFAPQMVIRTALPSPASPVTIDAITWPSAMLTVPAVAPVTKPAATQADAQPVVYAEVPPRAVTEVVQPSVPGAAAAGPSLPEQPPRAAYAPATQPSAPSHSDPAFVPSESPSAPVGLTPYSSLIENFSGAVVVASQPAAPRAINADNAAPVGLTPVAFNQTDIAFIPRAIAAAPPLVPIQAFAFIPSESAAVASPATLAPTSFPFTVDPLVIPALETGLPTFDAKPWRTPGIATEIGLSPARVKSLTLVLNAPVSVEEEAFEARAQALTKTGLPMGALNRVSYKISQPHIRFYNGADADVANALAAKFDVEARDFSKDGSTSGPNRIEFWMAGGTGATSAPAVSQAKPRTTKRKTTRTTVRRVDPKEALRQKLARRLRSGDHL